MIKKVRNWSFLHKFQHTFLGSFAFYSLLINLHAYSEVFATEPLLVSTFTI